MANNLVGLFDNHSDAQGAVNDLVAAGFPRDRISIVSADASGGVTTTDAEGNLAAEGAASGVSSGAVVGGIAGLLIGAGFTFLPVAGFLLAGPVAGLLTGAVAGAATGGVLGGLVGLGIPKEEAEFYAEGVRRGGTVVSVQAEADQESRARDILNRDGAVNIEERSADWRNRGYGGYDESARPFSDAEMSEERNRYARSPINSDWNDTANSPAPSSDATYASTVNNDWNDNTNRATGSVYGTTTPSTGFADANVPTGIDDATSYREHFNRSYPNGDYNRYAPAYDYGRDLANDPTYGSGDWNSNEAGYRSRWEERNPGSAWDDFKDSVRHAYDKAKNAVTGGNDGNRATLR